MTTEAYAKQKHAEKAAMERLWTHIVGITNQALARTGTDPASGLPGREEEIPGTGFAGTWGEDHFILTAAHVIEKAVPGDLKLFARPTPSLKHASRDSEITMEDAFSALPLGARDAVIHRCEWEDLALLVVKPDDFGPHLEFANIVGAWIDPSEGETVSGVGYPVSNGIIFQRQQGSSIQKSVLLNPVPFNGEVLPAAAGRYFKHFNQDQHYLLPFELANSGIQPGGISGAAIWAESPDKQVVWTPKFNFAGICTMSYKDGTVLQIVKASAVLRFLTEVFGALPE